ncbi:efflux RND transporter permease subunit [Caldicellulosiruptor saccharolyticus]|uniref:efflux RND transporter permease subunit n=1 Tax=Caldicellulosiruptor saccharolyticus TaxID=44001 RepID=UPI00005E57DC
MTISQNRNGDDVAVHKFGLFVAKHRKLVLAIAILLLIPSIYGFVTTKVNYDILTYLPKDLESVKGQDILDKEFKQAALSMLIVKGDMNISNIQKLKSKISQVDGVEKVIWIDDFLDPTIPKEMLPDVLKNTFYSKDSTLLLIQFKNSASSLETQNAISKIRKIATAQCFLSGMSAIIKDTRDLSDRETPLYVLVAVVFIFILLLLTMESPIVPILFLTSIGMAIIYNLGTNKFLGEISYITKSLAAVLQLGVTMDFSIFLMHRYDEERKRFDSKEEAMAEAISKTLVAILSSAATAIAGFLALCVMRLRIGADIGIVMAKGVFLGVIGTVTILPALILTFDRAIHKFRLKNILPTFSKTAEFATKYHVVLFVVFLLAFIPAIYGRVNIKEYYNLIDSLPKTIKSVQATDLLKKEYNMTTTHMVLVDRSVPKYQIKNMCEEIKRVKGVEKVLAFDDILGPAIPDEFIPSSVKENFEKGNFKLIMINSIYKSATSEENAQIERIQQIVKKYSKRSYVTGEGVLTKDLVEMADTDLKRVDFISILAIFMIILITFKSISIPLILVLAIELAIFINLAIPYYTNVTVPFIASIVLGTIQLGSAINYAILMTTRFREEIQKGHDRFEAIKIAVKTSSRSVVTSALAFAFSTLAVALIAKIDMIRSLCEMLSRGAVISMIVILFVLPSLLLLFEGAIAKTTFGWRSKEASVKPSEEYETL